MELVRDSGLIYIEQSGNIGTSSYDAPPCLGIRRAVYSLENAASVSALQRSLQNPRSTSWPHARSAEIGIAGHKGAFPGFRVNHPTRGRGQLLRNCIESLLTQDYPKDRFDIIVVEDGTNDGEKGCIGNGAGSPVRLDSVWIPHSGLAVARNVGAEKSSGEIVAYIDDDAMAIPGWLSQLVEALRMDGAGGAGGRVSPDYPDNTLVSEVEAEAYEKFGKQLEPGPGYMKSPLCRAATWLFGGSL